MSEMKNSHSVDTAAPAQLPAPGADGIERVLALARKHLQMDMAFLGEFSEGRQIVRWLGGTFGDMPPEAGFSVPLSETFCRLMVAGEIPNAVPDTTAHPALAALRSTPGGDIASYVGVPVRLRDGTLYGSFCCISRDPTPVGSGDVRALNLLAELLTAQVEAEREVEAMRRRIGAILEGQQIETALQPVVQLATGRVLGVEALSRFGAAGPPDVVFDEAHRAGLGERLETMAVSHAWHALGILDPAQYLAVNLTPQVAMALADVTVVEEHVDVPWAQVVVEITEHAAVDCYARLRRSLAPARALGLRLAIDDAGAGYASLHHVVELRPDIIKIDRSLVDNMATDSSRRSVVNAFVALAADLGATTVAEGVERPADLRVAFELGVGAAQGYLLGRPSTDRGQVGTWLSAGVPLPWSGGGARLAAQRRPGDGI